MSAREVIMVDAMRTAFGRMGGTLKDIFASKLASIGIRGLLDKTGLQERAHVDSVFLGTALGCSHSGNPARWAVLDSGLGYETSASYVEMQCGSAIDAINHAAWKILADQADIIIAASGWPNTVTADMVKEGAVVIDVGVNRVEDASRERGYRLVGDVDFDAVKEKASMITPVPGGVGPMTVAALILNTIRATERQGKA